MRAVATDRAVNLSMRSLENVLSGHECHDFVERFWDGMSWGKTRNPRFVLMLHHPGAVWEAGEQVYRSWRLYMAGSALAFCTGRLNLYQVLLSKPEHGRTHLPLTREDWYQASRHSNGPSQTQDQPLRAMAKEE